jgi:hypothetical protein
VNFNYFNGACSHLGPTTNGCIDFTLVHITNPYFNARYAVGASINVNSYPARPYDFGVEGSVFSHEFGHFLGLDEQYLHVAPPQSVCNPNANSIMDGGYAYTRFWPLPVQEVVASCDGNNLYSDDINNIFGGYGSGSVSNVSASVVGSSVNANWKDLAWGEGVHVPFLIRDAGTPNELLYAYAPVFDNIGAWQFAEDRTIAFTFVNVPPGYYTLCVAPYFPIYNVYGGGACHPSGLTVS